MFFLSSSGDIIEKISTNKSQYLKTSNGRKCSRFTPFGTNRFYWQITLANRGKWLAVGG